MKPLLRFGSFVGLMSLGCDAIDIGDFNGGATSGPADASTSDAGADGQSSAAETSESAGTTSGDATAASAEEMSAEGGAASFGAGTTGGGADVLCDPLLQDCAEGETCVWDDGVFRCFLHESTTPSGQVCASTNGCDVGLQCVDPESIGCSAEDPGCCSWFCDTSDPAAEICGPGRVCSEWFEAGLAPPGLEDVGVCRIDVAGSSDSGDETGAPAQCDAIAQDCADGETCVPDDDFLCLPAGNAAQFDPCVAVDDCQVALVCAPWDVVPGCAEASGACCTALCAVSSAPCNGGLTCTELPGGPFAGNEDAGYCTL